ncbi:TIGR02099 family protein [Massilia sp. MB5]|uniref:YhdP family protein n=1 Tax=Massilia sp. MB5 TaxID=2919578 RepID=UPI001F106ABF|nr:YhdP family protein [Massilia sp. MB5]UMR32954.1 TIGR02099 family protein [Massilia sp. MB5]
MQNSPQHTDADEGPLAARWHRLRAAYRVANLATHHLLGFTLKLALLLYFLFALLFLVLRYAVLPNIDHYKGDFERLASRAVGNPVSIARIYASWSGLRPTFFLGDVVLRDRRGGQALHLPSVSATLSWWSVAAADVRFDALELIRPRLDMRREADGKLYVAGVQIDLEKEGEGRGADWLLAQHEVVIREGRVDWTDARRATPTLSLENVNLRMRNQWRRHQLALQATPPAAYGAPVDLRADFTHPAFAARRSNVKLWKGELYADVRRADLTAWKDYVAYPFNLERGKGNVRAWFTLDHARLAAFTADVGLQEVYAQLGKTLPPVELAELSGRIAAREVAPPARATAAPAGTPAPAFGAYGFDASLNGFSLRTPDGVALAPAALKLHHAAAAASKPARTSVQAQDFDLAVLAQLASRLPLPAFQQEVLAEAAPRGRLLQGSAEWQGGVAAFQGLRLKAQVERLGMNALAARPAQLATEAQPATPALPALPGFEQLSGAFEAGSDGGQIDLDAPGLALHLPAWFDGPPLRFQQLKLRGDWSRADGKNLRVQLDTLQFEQDGLSASISGSHLLPLNGKGPGVADFGGKLDGFQLNTIARYLPIQTPEHLRHWLTGALEDGTAHEVSLRLRGDLAHFPFKADSPDRNKGEFRIAGRLDNGKLNYDPGFYAKDGKSPLWPQAEKIKGHFAFDRARMEIVGDTARTLGIPLANVKAVIPDLTIHDSVLDIDGTAAGPLQDFLKYLAASPVLEWIGHFTDETTASGNARLALKLHLPLNHIIESKVLGSLQLQGNDVVLWNDMPPVQQTTGKIEFNEKGVNLNNLAGNLLGGPVAINGGSQRDGAIVVKLGGSMTAEGLRKAYPIPLVQRLTAHVNGGARYSGLISVRDHQYQVSLESPLNGLGLDLPAPLKKAQADSLPLRFVLSGSAANEAGLARDEIRLGLGGGMSARYQRQRQGRAPWKMVRGGIGVNVPAPEPDSGLALNVSLKALDVDQWLDLGGAIGGKGEAGKEADGPELGQYVVPDSVAVRAGELLLGERKLDEVVLGASRQKGVWQASVDARQVSGYVTWSEAASGSGVGKVTARLSSLIIPESAANEVKDLLESSSSSPSIPALDIVAERFELFNKPLGKLELQAYNALITAAREWRVSKLALSNADGELTGTGRWLSKDGQHNTALNFNLDIHNAGKLLERFGFADTLRNGKGKLNGEISWKGLPYDFDIPSLAGTISMNVEKGQFLKQDPGAAKLLGVLSLQALPRLLKLDFNDVFSEGLAFDGIRANASISRGIVRTENLKMHGVAATVLMEGTADIANETTNLHVVVIPEVNLGTAPLVYALAVNPVIGLGGFLAQLFLSQPVMKALTYHMQVTGPWKAPVVTKLDGAKQEGAPQRKPQG